MHDARQALSTAISQRYPVGYAPQRVTPIDSQQSFSGATIYRVETAIGSFALRGLPPGAFPRPRIRGLHALLEFLHSRGIAQVAAPVRTISGETMWEFDRRDWHLEPWMPGHADFLADPRPEKLQNAMRCLAEWHRIATEWNPPRECAAWFSVSASGQSAAIADRLTRLDFWPGASLSALRRAVAKSSVSAWTENARTVLTQFEPLAEIVRKELRRLSPVRFSIQPCLRDIWADHVLFTGNEVTGLIDPTACRSDNVAVDLARLLGSFLGDDEPRWHEALRMYHERRPLGETERELVRVLDCSNVLLSAMTWLDRYFLSQVTIPHPAAALKRLAMYAKRIGHLANSVNRMIAP